MFKRKRHHPAHRPNFLLLYAEQMERRLLAELGGLKKRRRKIWHFYVQYGAFVLAIILVLTIVAAGLCFAPLKQVYSEAQLGKWYLQQAEAFEQNKNLAVALANAQQAQASLTKAQQDFTAQVDGKLHYFLIFNPLLSEVRHALTASNLTSQAITAGLQLKTAFASVMPEAPATFARYSKTQKTEVLSKIYAAETSLEQIDSELKSAQAELAQIKLLPWLITGNSALLELSGAITASQNRLAGIRPLAQALPKLLGYPQAANYLVFFQNNNELRPTGGFLGSYGILTVQNGEITAFKTDDVNNLDRFSVGKLQVASPVPLAKYIGQPNLFLRDANWSPDWPTTAQTLAWFYNQENKNLPTPHAEQNFVGVIGITPNLINDFLTLTGPIKVGTDTYDKNNFTSLLEYNVEVNYKQQGLARPLRKEVIGQVAQGLEQKIFALSAANWQQLIYKIADNIVKKNILVYLTDPQMQVLTANTLNWSGEVKATGGDYFLVDDANLGALKTDAVMNRRINYTLRHTKDGLIAELQVDYANSGKIADWQTTTYKDYVRVYVPQGSQLLGSAGWTQDKTAVSTDLGKTVFTGYLTVGLGQIVHLDLQYKLPDSLTNAMVANNQYSLIAQRQPGSRLNYLQIDLAFAKPIKSYQPASLYTQLVNAQEVRWTSDFSNDKNYQVQF